MNRKLLAFVVVVIALLAFSVAFLGETDYRAWGKQLKVSHILYKPEKAFGGFLFS
jgi:hypothetical protein